MSGRVVLHDHAAYRREQLSRALGRDRLLRLDVDGLRVADKDRHPNGRAGDAQIRQMEDLATLRDDLPFLPRVAVLEEDVDFGKGVEGDRMRVDPGLLRLAGHMCPDLALELDQGVRTRSGHALVGIDDDALEAHAVAQRHQDGRELHGRAVRIGDDSLVARRILRVHLAHDQRYAGFHPPRIGVVDDGRATIHGLRGQLSGDVRAD